MKPFPFSYTGEVTFYKPSAFSELHFEKSLEHAFKGTWENHTLYTSIFGLLPILKSKVALKQNTKDSNLSFSYSISMFENNVVLLLAMAFVFFFHFNDQMVFAWLIAGGGLLFYIFNALAISKYIKKNFKLILGQQGEPSMESLWEKQQVWMKNPKQCSACGEPINEYSPHCINCGLMIQANKKAPSNQTATYFKDLNFTYKKK